MIYTTREYQPGSIVSVKVPGGEITGKIEEINMKNLIIRSFDFRRVVIPNFKFVKAVIRTYSLESVLKLDIELNVDMALDIEKVLDVTIKKANTYDFVIYKEYTQALIQSFDQKACKLKVSFCFNPNAGIPTDLMKSRVQAGLIEEYKKLTPAKIAA